MKYKNVLNKMIGFVRTNKLKLVIALICFIAITTIGVVTSKTVFNHKKSSNTSYCTIRFESNGGTPIEEQKVKCGTIINEPTKPIKDGFEFQYWDYNGERFDFNNTINVDITLNAIYVKEAGIETITITFDSNGGSIINPVIIKKGSVLKKPNDPTKKGYIFAGWYAGYKKFDFSKIVNEDILLKAKWEEKKEQVKVKTSNKNYKCSGTFRSDIPEKNVKIGYSDHVNWTWSTYGGYGFNEDGTNPCYETYKTSDSSVASIDKNGIIKAKKIGIAYISECINDKETKKEIICFKGKLIVEPKDAEVINNEIWLINCGTYNYTMEIGQTQRIPLDIYPKDYKPTTFTWTSDDNNIVKVLDNNGNIKAISKGSIWVFIKSANGTVGACPITVIPKQVHITNISLNKNNLELTKGDKIDLYASILPENATNKNVTWTSSNTSVVTVNSSGKVTAVGKGHAMITASTEDGNKTATCFVTVTSIDVSAVSLNNTLLELFEGSVYNLVATISPSNATNKNVTWTSSNPSVATVNNNGKITAIAAGSTIITVTTEDGNKKATCNITVKKVSVSGISLNKTILELVKGSSYNLVATISPSNAANKRVTWTSSTPSVATVNSSGKVTAVGVGNTKITVTTEDGNKTATCNLNVVNPPLTAYADIGIAFVSTGSGTTRGVDARIFASGGSGLYNYYNIKLYKDGSLIGQSSNTSSSSLFVPGYSNGSYYAKYEIHDTDGTVYNGTSNTTTISGF